jgi:hypothetical protein
MVGGRDAAATSFTPISYLVTVANPALSANSNIVVDYTIDSPDSLASAHVSFLPSAFGVASGSSLPDGAIVGSITIAAAEAESNGPCSNLRTLGYELLDASIDTSAGNTLVDSPRIPSASWPGLLDVSPSNSLADAVDKYPNFLKTLYPGLTPVSRSYGSIGSGVGVINRVVNLLVFAPGTVLPGLSPLPASLGHIVVVVQQDPTAPAATSVVTESCSTYQYRRQDKGLTDNNTSTPANEGGVVYRTNPATDGSYSFLEYLRSKRDQDNDGIENEVDSCPFVSTPSWNPRINDPVWDIDSDGIPGQDDGLPGELLVPGTGCDPTPSTANSDPDGDGFVNRQDNCPLTMNGAAQDNQADPDRDGIGSACDVVDSQPDGHLHEVCATANVTIGAGGTPTPPACPELVLDMDNDGFEKSVELHVGTDPTDPCGTTAWPADLNSTGLSTNDVDLLDITSFLAPTRHLNTSPGDLAYNVRWDLKPGAGVPPLPKVINIVDLTALIVLVPPMLEGPRAFSGPPCPYAP